MAEEFISQLKHYYQNKALGVILSGVLKNTLVEKLLAGLDNSLVCSPSTNIHWNYIGLANSEHVKRPHSLNKKKTLRLLKDVAYLEFAKNFTP